MLGWLDRRRGVWRAEVRRTALRHAAVWRYRGSHHDFNAVLFRVAGHASPPPGPGSIS